MLHRHLHRCTQGIKIKDLQMSIFNSFYSFLVFCTSFVRRVTYIFLFLASFHYFLFLHLSIFHLSSIFHLPTPLKAWLRTMSYRFLWRWSGREFLVFALALHLGSLSFNIITKILLLQKITVKTSGKYVKALVNRNEISLKLLLKMQ